MHVFIYSLVDQEIDAYVAVFPFMSEKIIELNFCNNGQSDYKVLRPFSLIADPARAACAQVGQVFKNRMLEIFLQTTI